RGEPDGPVAAADSWVPAEEHNARAAPPHRATRARTTRQDHCARPLRVRQPLVSGLRSRGNPVPPPPVPRPRPLAAQQSAPARARAPRRSLLPPPLGAAVPQGVPARRWRGHGPARHLRLPNPAIPGGLGEQRRATMHKSIMIAAMPAVIAAPALAQVAPTPA